MFEKIIYTFVATSRAKKIAYDVGRDSLPLTIDQDVPYIPLGTYFGAHAMASFISRSSLDL